MQEENKNKLMSPEEAAAMMDLRRDYVYGRGVTVENDETHLRDYWRIVRRRLWIPIGIVIVTVTLATIYNLRLPSIYEGVTEVDLEREDRTVNLKDFQINMGGGDDSQYINTQLQIMKSPRVAYLVAKSLDLEHNSEFAPGLHSGTLSSQTLEATNGESDEAAEMERLTAWTDTLVGSIEIKPVRETRLVEIHYRHTNKELARKIADTWAESFIANNLKSRYDANKESGKFLEKSIADYKLRVKEADERLLNYRRDHQILDFGEKENTVSERLVALNQLLLQAETERKTAQLAYDMSRGVADVTTLPEIQRDPIAQELTKKITELRQQREQLLVEFTPEWPDVKKVEQQLSRLEGELRASHQRVVSTIDNQYRTATAKEEGLQKAFAQQRAETLHQNEGAITAKMLQKEVDTNNQMLTNLMSSQQGVEISAASMLRSNNIRITKLSPKPNLPVAPKRTQNIMLAALLALIGGIGLVLFLDYINNKIESVEDIDRYMKLPALGVIPVLQGGKARRLTSGKAGKELVPAGNNSQVILTQLDATSPVAESYRQLRTALLLSSAGHAPRTLLFTSSQPAEGKTTTSVNTAISLAQTGAAVLIVDADLRRPRVHKVFGLKNNAGLSNYLAGEGELASLIQIAMPNLYVLPVGPLPPNPAELLGSAKMKTVVETLSTNFDYVVIDSPPVSSFADSLILSSLVEGVIIVVKGGVTPREMAQRTKAHLQSVGAKILGVVINQIKLQPHDYYYYSTYYSRYYYGNGDGDEEGEKARA